MPNLDGYNRAGDVDVESVPSPLDPWGMLTSQEKARAAVLHAALVRNPPAPYVRPERPAEQVHPRYDDPYNDVRPGEVHQRVGSPTLGVCAFTYGEERAGHLPITHEITRSPLHAIGSHVCLGCAEAIMDPDYHHHAVRALRANQAPNGRVVILDDETSRTAWDSTVPGIIITETVSGRSYELRHEPTMTVITGGGRGNRYRRMNNAIRVARALQHMCDWTEPVIPEHAGDARRAPVIAGVPLDVTS